MIAVKSKRILPLVLIGICGILYYHKSWKLSPITITPLQHKSSSNSSTNVAAPSNNTRTIKNAGPIGIMSNMTLSAPLPACCYEFKYADLKAKFAEEKFWAFQRTLNSDVAKFTGDEYNEWISVSSKVEGLSSSDGLCSAQWKYTVLNEMEGFYLRGELTNLVKGGNGPPGYIPLQPNLPRILLLGDSISRNTGVETQRLYGKDESKLASIQAVPFNCGGLSLYRERLQHWLGDCVWDAVHFNVGHHTFGVNLRTYTNGLENIVASIRMHSPKSKIVFALTTPSPFDSNATWPNKTTCKSYNNFIKQGGVTTLNEAAKSSLSKLNVTINDRYAAIQPNLSKYQRSCDIHYSVEGYEILAKQDWMILSKLLNLTT